MWCLANSNGFIYHAEPYCGSSTNLLQSKYGQGGSVVLGLLEHSALQKGTKLYFDNLFSSVGLLDELTQLGYGGTGTLRENRLPKEARFINKSDMSKLERASMESKSDGKLNVVRWNDNAVVTVITNCIPLKPLKNVSR